MYSVSKSVSGNRNERSEEAMSQEGGREGGRGGVRRATARWHVHPSIHRSVWPMISIRLGAGKFFSRGTSGGEREYRHSHEFYISFKRIINMRSLGDLGIRGMQVFRLFLGQLKKGVAKFPVKGRKRRRRRREIATLVGFGMVGVPFRRCHAPHNVAAIAHSPNNDNERREREKSGMNPPNIECPPG